jgi:hypothetical protein
LWPVDQGRQFLIDREGLQAAGLHEIHDRFEGMSDFSRLAAADPKVAKGLREFGFDPQGYG